MSQQSKCSLNVSWPTTVTRINNNYWVLSRSCCDQRREALKSRRTKAAEAQREGIITCRELNTKLICSQSVPKEGEEPVMRMADQMHIGGRLFPISVALWKKTSLFLKVIVAVIRERLLLRVTAEGLRGSGWLDNLVPIPGWLPSVWASPPLACPGCLLVWTQSAGWNYLPAQGKLNMISDLSFWCSTVTFADPPTLRDPRNEQGMKRKGCVFL